MGDTLRAPEAVYGRRNSLVVRSARSRRQPESDFDTIRAALRLLQAASACRCALDPFVEDDSGAVQAGDLTWDVRQTVRHHDAGRWRPYWYHSPHHSRQR